MAFSLLRNCCRKTFYYHGLIERNSIITSAVYLQNNNYYNNHIINAINTKESSSTTLNKQQETYLITNNNKIPTIIIRNYSSKKVKKDKKNGYNSGSDSDSDSEVVIKGRERGSSDFWRRKMRTIHGLLDINKDGVISFDDFKLLADKFAALGHLTPEEIVEFQEIIQRTWEEQWGEVSPYNLITVEQYLTEMHHMLNDKDLKKKIHLFLPYLFMAVDKDNSGFISLEEYKIFFNCLGLTDEDAAVSFAIIDKNGDGKLSIKEFVKLGRDYFFSEDEKRISRMFWGPIVLH